MSETIAYEFGAPRPSVKRAVRSKHYWTWRICSLILSGPPAAIMAFIFVSAMMSVPPGNRPEAAIDADFIKLIISLAPWTMLLIAGIIISGVSIEIRDVKQKIVRQKMRDLYVTDKDWSFSVMFPNGATFDFWRPKLIQVASEFFADPDVIEADRVIQESTTKEKKAVKEYKAKLKLIHLAQASYLAHHINEPAVFEEFNQQRLRLNEQMHPQLQEALDALEVKQRALQRLVADTQSSEAVQ